MAKPMYKRGVGLAELVIYVAVFSIIVTVVVSGMIQEAKLLRRARAERAVATAAETILERIVRELRLACSTPTPLTTPSNTISLATFADLSSPSAADCTTALSTRTISLSGQDVLLGSAQLDPSGITVSGLTFIKVTTPVSTVSDAIAVKLTLSSGAAGSYQVTRTYHTTAIMRGSYDAKNPN